MNFDLRKLPFSRFGSYSVIQIGNPKEKDIDNSLFFRDAGSGDNSLGYIFKINILCDNYDIETSETLLSVKDKSSDKFLNIIFPDENRVRFFSNGLAFSFDFILGSYDHINVFDNKYEVHNYTNEMKLMLRVLDGNCDSKINWDKIQSTQGLFSFSGDYIDVDIERYQTVSTFKDLHLTFIEESELALEHYEKYKESVSKVKLESLNIGRDLATYILYSVTVHPLGLLNKYALYMSKNWMTNIWSWDNLFNALGLCTWNEELALDQITIFNSVQDKSGILPDTVNNLYASFNCTKPPIQGWAYMLMMELNDYFAKEEIVKQVYSQFVGIEKYWSTYRINDNFPLPYYNHGNDSGWDNATPFAKAMPVTTPDLPTYMILLYECLEKLSNILGLEDKANIYSNKKRVTIDNLIKHLWDGNKFRSYQHCDKGFTTTGNSLIEYLPILIYKHLPNDIAKQLLAKFKNEGFITDIAIATESINSPYYETEGYWRGPYWAPTSLIFIDALKNIGEIELSKKLALSYCENACKFGMCENYDPITGTGFDDPAFAWTSSVFLLLANKYI